MKCPCDKCKISYTEINEIRYHSMDVSVPFYSVPVKSTYGVDYVVGLVGNNFTGVQYRIFTWPQLTTLFNYLMSDAYYVDMLGVFGSTDPSAKVAVNPLQYILSIRAFPSINLTSSAVVLENDYYVGPLHLVSDSQHTFSCYRKVDVDTGLEVQIIKQTTTTSLVNNSSWAWHPQTDPRGQWINAAHAKYTLSAPPFGTLQLDPSIISHCDGFILNGSLDLSTGLGQLALVYYRDMPSGRKYSAPTIVQAPVGVDIPISVVTSAGFGAHQIASILSSAVPSAIGAAVAGPAGAVAGIMSVAGSAIGSVTESRIAKGSHVGSQGSLINYQLSMTLTAEYTMLAAEDNNSLGRPLCQIRQLNNIPGYIKADPDDLSLSCTVSELDEIRTAIREGFYYE